MDVFSQSLADTSLSFSRLALLPEIGFASRAHSDLAILQDSLDKLVGVHPSHLCPGQCFAQSINKRPKPDLKTKGTDIDVKASI